MFDAIKTVIDNNRKEITLTGSDINGHEEEFFEKSSGFHKMTEINLLRITKTSLTALPDSLGALTNLVHLICQNNKLAEIPACIGNLSKLKSLDLSNNELQSLPQEIGSITTLTTLNLSCNKLTNLPDLIKCINLATLDASHNQLTEFPNIDVKMTLLAEVILSGNQITSIPQDIFILISLKNFLLENNLILEVPGNLIDCPKLKILKLNGNELKDRRFRKLVENGNTKPEQIMKYIKQHIPKKAVEIRNNDVVAQNGKETEAQIPKPVPHIIFQKPTITIVPPQDNMYVKISPEALVQRPYMVCCLVMGVSMAGEQYRKFIVKQTELNTSVCNKRLNSTIATHDFSQISLVKLDPVEGTALTEGLLFTTRDDSHRFKPLFCRSNAVSIKSFIGKVKLEAEAHRKDNRSNTTTGLYRYLELVKHWTRYPVFMDANENTLSVPPLTNGDLTKITSSTVDMLLEVSSGKSLKYCKEAMTQLIQSCLDYSSSENRDLTIRQIRVVNESDNGLRCVFPASDDLMTLTTCHVVRPR